jgi:uncharacterized membrane protein
MTEQREDQNSNDARSSRFSLMPKSRFEAFSDGVLAIVITILVLELAVPGESNDLLSALGAEWASYLGYLVSFVFVGGIWLAHADLSRFMKQTDRVLMRLNLLLLLFVSFLPYTTSLMAEHLTDAGQRVGVVIFGANLFVGSLMMSLLAAYVGRHPELAADELDREQARSFVRRRVALLVLNGLSVVVGFLLPTVAVVLYLAVTVGFVAEPLVNLRRLHRGR